MTAVSETKGKKKITAVGLEYDLGYIRAVKITGDELGNFNLELAVEERGTFTRDEDLVESLTKIKQKLGGGRYIMVSNLTGKQIHTSQLAFRLMPAEQMPGALKIHLRKIIPFEIAGSTVEYQVIKEPSEKGGQADLIVSVASKAAINRQIRNLDKAGFKPQVMDILPLALGNALRKCGDSASATPQVAIHMGPSVCTVVIDGPGFPYLHRSVYFATDEVFGDKKEKIPLGERERKLNALGQEIARSITFYEKTYGSGNFQTIFITGEYVDEPSLLESLGTHTGLEIHKMAIAALAANGSQEPPGKYDLALALALGALPQRDARSCAYTANMVRDLRLAEKKAETSRVMAVMAGWACFGVLALAILYTVLKVLTMESILDAERQRLWRLQEAYKKYTATRAVVDKSDIELLDTLQGSRIFWTRKLAAMAMHLPDNYWITEFSYKRKEMNVSGYGYITPDQEQLVTLDDYLNLLRQDSTFNDDFARTYLNLTERDDEGRRLRVGFDYSSTYSKTSSTYSSETGSR